MLAVLFALYGLTASGVYADSPLLTELWSERVKSVVAVEFYVDAELERQQIQTFGTVVDDGGTIIFPAQSISDRLSRDQLSEFRVYLPGSTTWEYHEATYLGHDELTGWEFIRVANPEIWKRMIPISQYRQSAVPQITQALWGVGLRKKEENFAPYFMSSRVSILQRLPQHLALAAQEVAGLGLPVYNQEGDFVGLGVGGFGQTFLQFSGRDRGGLPVVMINPDECAAVLLAEEITPFLHRIPNNRNGRPLAWLGSSGLQPLDPDVARFLKLENQAGLVVSEILEGSPAAAAGLHERDILLTLDGEALPLLKPDRVLVAFLDREINRRIPGDILRMGVLRDGQHIEIKALLTDAPELPQEAPRRYFEDLGLSVRGFTYVDGVARKLKVSEHRGVIAHFVKPNSPINASGLRQDDWITEIEEKRVLGYENAARILEEIGMNASRTEFTLLVERGGEPVLLRVRLK